MLNKNQELVTREGEKVELISPLVDGAHCNVYRVMYNDEPYILKWNENDDYAYYKTLESTIELLRDCEELISPKAIVINEDSDGASNRFGYLMPEVTADYHKLTDYFRMSNDPKSIAFSSYRAQLKVALDIVSFMQKIHLRGLLMNIEPDDMYINNETGAIRIVDSEKVFFNGVNETMRGGNLAYLAPEIPRSDYELNPSVKTDKYPMAVVLYRLFFVDHPMEGKVWEKYPLLTDKVEVDLYALNPVFHFNLEDSSNRPTECYAVKAAQRWRVYPKELRDVFVKTFTKGINDPNNRPSENEWISVLSNVRDKLILIHQGREQFVNFSDLKSIPPRCLDLKIGSNHMAIYPQKAIYQISVDGNAREYATIVGGIVYDKQANKMKIRNMSSKVWRCYDPTTKQLTDVGKGQEYPLFPGAMIEFHRDQPKIVGEISDPKANK